MADRGVDLLDSEDLLTRLTKTFPDNLLAAHRQTVRLSRKSEADTLAPLLSIVGTTVAEIIRDPAAGQA